MHPYRNGYTPYRRHVNAWEAARKARMRRYEWFDRHPYVRGAAYLLFMIPLAWAAFLTAPIMGFAFVGTLLLGVFR